MSATDVRANELTLVLMEFDDDDRALLQDFVGPVYDLYADKAGIGARLRYWYTVRHCCDRLLKGVYKQVDTKEADESVSGSDLSTNLQELRRNAQTEINKIEKQVNASSGFAVGAITTTAPLAAFPNAPDPNDTVYRGDPRKRR